MQFLEDGCIEMDTNSVERAIRPIALNRRSSLFAGPDQGAINWACLASLVETAKLHGLDPQAYPADILSKLVNGWPMAKITTCCPGPGRNKTPPARRPNQRYELWKELERQSTP